MSDTPQGPGWWMAADGRWYPPDTAPPGWSSPAPGAAYVGPRTTNKRARNSLILGIVAFFCFGVLLGPAAVVEGVKARREIANSAVEEGDGLALAGIICGAIAAVLSVLGIVYLLTADGGGSSGY